MAFQIGEEPVFAGVIGEPSLDRHSQQLVAQTHWTARENALIHRNGIANDWTKFHPGEDITLNVDTGRDFDEFNTIPRQFEHTALRHIKHWLPAVHCILAGKRAMFDLADKLCLITILDQAQASVLDRHAETTRCEGTDEHDLLGILTDIDEAAGARQARAKFAHIQIALAVGLREPKKRCVKSAAVTPPMTPGSAVSVSKSAIFSSFATLAIPSGMPMPRLTTLFASSSSAARRAMIFRSLIFIGVIDPAGARISP